MRVPKVGATVLLLRLLPLFLYSSSYLNTGTYEQYRRFRFVVLFFLAVLFERTRVPWSSEVGGEREGANINIDD